MKKTAFVLLCLILSVSALCAAAYAEAADARVYDLMALFDAEERASLEEQITQLRGKTGMDFVIVAINDSEGKSSEEYADDFYDTRGFGTGSNHSGALLLIDMDNREVHISTSGEMIDYLTDARIESILDEVVPHLGNGEYHVAASAFLEYAGRYYETGVPKGQYRQDESGAVTRYRSITPGEIVICAVISLAAGIGGVLAVHTRYQKPAVVYRYPFRQKGSVNLTMRDDLLVNRIVTQSRIEPPSGGPTNGGGRSSTHTSSGGMTHGGGGRKF